MYVFSNFELMSLVYFNGDEEIEIFNDNSFCSSGKILGIFDFCK